MFLVGKYIFIFENDIEGKKAKNAVESLISEIRGYKLNSKAVCFELRITEQQHRR